MRQQELLAWVVPTLYIKYPNIYLANTELWSADGIHLSNVGNERFLNSLQHALENIVLYGAVVYP